MNILRNIKIKTIEGFDLLLDAYYLEDGTPKPIIIFSHGFKGFKDWGVWNLVAKEIAQSGYIFIKYNFSHNGTTVDHPLDFVDLGAFGRNTYTHELNDLQSIINGVQKEQINIKAEEKDTSKIFLIGHSRGGGTSLVKGAQKDNIAGIITWASVSGLDYFMKDPIKMADWEKTGVSYVLNGRTKQNMPLYYSLYEDYKKNVSIYDIAQVCQKITCPVCIIHGTDDTAVALKAAYDIKKWTQISEVHEIDGANHVFGGTHPYTASSLPKDTQEMVNLTIDFLKRNT